MIILYSSRTTPARAHTHTHTHHRYRLLSASPPTLPVATTFFPCQPHVQNSNSTCHLVSQHLSTTRTAQQQHLSPRVTAPPCFTGTARRHAPGTNSAPRQSPRAAPRNPHGLMTLRFSCLFWGGPFFFLFFFILSIPVFIYMYRERERERERERNSRVNFHQQCTQ